MVLRSIYTNPSRKGCIIMGKSDKRLMLKLLTDEDYKRIKEILKQREVKKEVKK